MENKQFSQIKLYFVSLITLIVWSTLIWQYFHDGVPSHHLLHRADLPSISNWWGGILLPALSWGLLGRIQKRLFQSSYENTSDKFRQLVFRFTIAFCYGVVLSQSFALGYPEISSIMFPGIVFFALFFKIYREEYVLGFIISMSFTFGAVLPTMFGALIAFVAFIVYHATHFIWKRIKDMTLSKQV